MARGARRPASPFSGKLDLFYIGEISFVLSTRSSLHTLREVQILEPFDASNLPSPNLFLCSYFAELADLVTEPCTPVTGLFELLTRALTHLKSHPASLRALDFFEKELARSLGIGDAASHPLAALEAHCGRIPKSRAPLLLMLKA
jgi:DNA repair protein RecO (recombination protein O)